MLPPRPRCVADYGSFGLPYPDRKLTSDCRRLRLGHLGRRDFGSGARVDGRGRVARDAQSDDIPIIYCVSIAKKYLSVVISSGTGLKFESQHNESLAMLSQTIFSFSHF